MSILQMRKLKYRELGLPKIPMASGDRGYRQSQYLKLGQGHMLAYCQPASLEGAFLDTWTTPLSILSSYFVTPLL